MRLANVGRALFMAVWIDALNVWGSGIHARGLVIGGVGTFVLGLLMFEGFEWRDRRRETSMPGPPPSLPPVGAGSGQDSSIGGNGTKADG